MPPKLHAPAKLSTPSRVLERPLSFGARYFMLVGMLCLILLTGAMTWVTLSRIKTIERTDLQNTLENILLITEESIYNWYLARKAYIETHTTSLQIRDLTKSLLSRHKNHSALSEDASLSKIRDLFDENLLMHGYLDFSIIAPDFTIIASMGDDLLDQPSPIELNSQYLEKVFRGHFQLTHPIRVPNPLPDQAGSPQSQPSMHVCAPIKDESDAVIAALTLKIDPDYDFSQIVYIGRFGDTGDTYAFDKNATLLTQSRFEDTLHTIGLLKTDQHSVLNVCLRDPGGDLRSGFRPEKPLQEHPLTRMAVEAVAGRHGTDLDGYRDYRGAMVVGTWTWMSELDIGLATEIELEEAFRSLNSTRLIVMIGLAVIVGMFLIFTTLLVKNNRRIRLIADQLEHSNRQLNLSHQRLERQHRELKNAQAQLVHSEKMAGLGTLVAGVAHEINNPANFIGSCTQDMEKRLNSFQAFILDMLGENKDHDTVQMFDDKFEPLFKDLAAVKEGNDRIKQIVSELKIFSQLDEAEMKASRLTPGLRSTIHLVETQYRSQIQIVTDFQADPVVICRPAKLNQVFMNMVINAVQAIDRKKALIGEEFSGKIHLSTSTNGNMLEIRFQDNGEGIPEEIRSKLFEPFFTTKAVGEGTGLGLSISYRIIEEHGGRIEIDSTIGEGTTFTVHLPLDPSKE